mmetsp:Transcript_3578/g.6228  ORF Transcript_3578/g.6228 Transcript_3578/m.6228 type:complete len:119 (-) Transcript_3578:83-439(-)
MQAAVARSVSRQVTADGRNSLREHLWAPKGRENGVSGVVKKILFKPELMPLFACIGSAFVLVGTFGTRHLFSSPNVHVSKTARKQSIRPAEEHERVGRRFTRHRESMRNMANYVEKSN